MWLHSRGLAFHLLQCIIFIDAIVLEYRCVLSHVDTLFDIVKKSVLLLLESLQLLFQCLFSGVDCVYQDVCIGLLLA